MISVARRRYLTPTLIGLAVVVLLAIVVGSVWFQREELYVEFPRPDGRFKILVYRRPGLLAMAPGQSGDAPGRVLLVDGRGNVLREAPVEMVQLIEVPEWREDAVEVRPFGDWPLPR
jgi:hypothetical protein